MTNELIFVLGIGFVSLGIGIVSLGIGIVPSA